MIIPSQVNRYKTAVECLYVAASVHMISFVCVEHPFYICFLPGTVYRGCRVKLQSPSNRCYTALSPSDTLVLKGFEVVVDHASLRTRPLGHEWFLQCHTSGDRYESSSSQPWTVDRCASHGVRTSGGETVWPKIRPKILLPGDVSEQAKFSGRICRTLTLDQLHG